jgi:hypothetical protein
MGFFPNIPQWRWSDFLEMIKVVLHEAIPKRDYIYMYGIFLYYYHCVSQAEMICTGENY